VTYTFATHIENSPSKSFAVDLCLVFHDDTRKLSCYDRLLNINIYRICVTLKSTDS